MDDIYRHIMMSPPASPPSNNSLISSTLLTNKLARRQDKNDETEYEVGDVTGYAMQHPGVMVSVVMTMNSVHILLRTQLKLQNSNDGLPAHMNQMLENLHNHHQANSMNHVAGNKIGNSYVCSSHLIFSFKII